MLNDLSFETEYSQRATDGNRRKILLVVLSCIAAVLMLAQISTVAFGSSDTPQKPRHRNSKYQAGVPMVAKKAKQKAKQPATPPDAPASPPAPPVPAPPVPASPPTSTIKARLEAVQRTIGFQVPSSNPIELLEKLETILKLEPVGTTNARVEHMEHAVFQSGKPPSVRPVSPKKARLADAANLLPRPLMGESLASHGSHDPHNSHDPTDAPLSDTTKADLITKMKNKIAQIEDMVVDNGGTTAAATTTTTTTIADTTTTTTGKSASSSRSTISSREKVTVSALGVSALFLGAVAARFLRRRGLLRSCIENEAYDDFNYEDDGGTIGSEDKVDRYDWTNGSVNNYGTAASAASAAGTMWKRVKSEHADGLERFDV